MRRLAKDARERIRITLNGAERDGWCDSRTTLADFLRHELGATGTRVGCEHGVCGSCTVRVDGTLARACMMLAIQAEGRRVDTVEGLAGDGPLGDLQEAFRRHHALQCGFCTAGILVSGEALLLRNPAPTEAQVREHLSGHLCRCTGYTNIVNAVLDCAAGRRRRKDA